MSRKTLWYKGIWYGLRSLVYTKRGLSWLARGFGRGAGWVYQKYQHTLGFRFYKAGFYLRRHLVFLTTLRKYNPWQIIGERRALQFLILAFLLTLSFPHLRLFALADTYTSDIPGHKTLLYQLVGPGDQDFSTVEDASEDVLINLAPDRQSWRAGAVVVEPGFVIGERPNLTYDNGNSVAVDGSALVKPLHIGALESRLDGVVPGQTRPTQNRTGLVIYQVKSGDVLGSIANRFGISLETLTSANGLTMRSYIRPGDQLKILPVDGVVHTIKKGDTISKIALVYSAKATDIAEFNQLVASGTGLTIGREIVVPYGHLPSSVAVRKVTRPRPATNNQATQGNVVIPPPSFVPAAVSGYIWPSGATIITQYYGWRHTGVDIAGKIGLPNYAARSGTVIKSQCGWNGGYGCYVIIDHGNGVQTLYGHNSKLLVSPGEFVSQGQVIALLGSTGRSTGPHLHFEVRINGKRANPLQYVRR